MIRRILSPWLRPFLGPGMRQRTSHTTGTRPKSWAALEIFVKDRSMRYQQIAGSLQKDTREG